MKKLILNIVSSKFVADMFLDLMLNIDNQLYKLISLMAIAKEDGKHPKHNILKYEDWFKNKIKKESTVVDVGCNKGTLLQNLASKISRGFGVEIEEKHIVDANKNNKFNNIEYICADATSYDFSKFDKIDYLTLSNVLEHIENRVYFLKSLLRNIENPNCVVLIRVPLITRDWVSCYKKSRGLEYRLDKTHYIEYTELEIKKELEDSGLEVESMEVKFGEIYAVCKQAV